MPKSNNSRKGIKRNRWVCPQHPKEGNKKTVVGKPCPTCGTMGSGKES